VQWDHLEHNCRQSSAMSVADSGTSSRRFGGGSWRVWLLGNRPVTRAHPELFDAVCMSWLAGSVPHRVAMDTAALIPEDVPIVAGGGRPSPSPFPLWSSG